MTELENRINENIKDLKMIRGALMIVSETEDSGVPDYLGACAQKTTMAHIVERELATLDGVIDSLCEIVPKQEEND